MPEQMSILLVEDEFLLAEVVKDALLEAGYLVHHELNGDKAIRQLAGDGRFSCLVTDIRMPGLTTGWDVARHARELNPQIVVVYTSGDSGHEYKTERVPCSTFVQKPFPPDRVTRAVLTLLEGETSPGHSPA